MEIHIWENITKYFHRREADLEEIKWLWDLSNLWEYKIQFILFL